MRPVEQWEESDLLALIADGAQEGLRLEFKASAALGRDKKIEISKDVSAFANSDGGVIIYGMVEEKGYPIRLDAGSDPATINGDWLEQVLSSNIAPRIHGIRIISISLPSGGAAFAVEVPKSLGGGPHQAGDQKYYRRFESRSVPMYDHEIRDVMNRAVAPDLEFGMTVTGAAADGQAYEMLVDVEISNRSPVPCLYASCAIYVEETLVVEGVGAEWEVERIMMRDPPGNAFWARRISLAITVPNQPPIYRERSLRLGALHFKFPDPRWHILGISLVAPNFSVRRTTLFGRHPPGPLELDWYPEGDPRNVYPYTPRGMGRG
jgi:hypothetical protein